MKKSSILRFSLLVMFTFALTSCLHDLENFTGDFSSSPAIAEIPEASNPSTGTIVREIIDPTKPADFLLKLNIASANYLKTDTKITLVIDTSLIGAYNTSKGLTGSAKAIPVPAAAISTASYDVTIPAGKREADWAFSVNASLVPNSVTTFYLIAVKIASATNGLVISGNYGTKLIRVSARNKFDGVYTVTGSLVDAAAGTITGNYPTTFKLVTSGQFTCRVDEPSTAPYGTPNCFHSILSGGSFSVYGSFGIVITFDASNNVASVVNYYGQPASNTRSAQIDPSGVNKYDGTTKKVTIKYFMLQPSSIPAPPYIRTSFNEVWTYTGPR